MTELDQDLVPEESLSDRTAYMLLAVKTEKLEEAFLHAMRAWRSGLDYVPEECPGCKECAKLFREIEANEFLFEHKRKAVNR